MAMCGADKDFTPGVIWDHQLYEMDVFGIPAGNPNKKPGAGFHRLCHRQRAAGGGGELGGVTARRGARPSPW